MLAQVLQAMTTSGAKMGVIEAVKHGIPAIHKECCGCHALILLPPEAPTEEVGFVCADCMLEDHTMFGSRVVVGTRVPNFVPHLLDIDVLQRAVLVSEQPQ